MWLNNTLVSSNSSHKQRRRLSVQFPFIRKYFGVRGSTSMTKFSRRILYIYTHTHIYILYYNNTVKGIRRFRGGDRFARSTVCPGKTVVRRMYTYFMTRAQVIRQRRCYYGHASSSLSFYQPVSLYRLFTFVFVWIFCVNAYNMCTRRVWCLPLSAIETRMPFVPGSHTPYGSHLKNSRSLLSRK